MIFGYGKGAKPASTNAPDETSCQAVDCHTKYPLNSGSGNIQLTGVPEYFERDSVYSLGVRLAQEEQKRWGFQITALNQHNLPAGNLIVSDKVHTRFKWGEGTTAPQRQYIEHTLEGSYMGVSDGPVSWTIDWRAPADGADTIYFYTVGNAANFNKKPTGDFIYTRVDTTFSISQQSR